MNGVQKRGAAEGASVGDAPGDQIEIGGEGDGELGRSLNSTRKNSSSELAVLKNVAAASAGFMILVFMLPLVSKTRPMETGASSLEKCVIFCSTPSSKISKLLRARLVTVVPSAVVTCTGMSARAESTRSRASGMWATPGVVVDRSVVRW